MPDRDPLNVVGQTIADKYLIERLVGEGGFAVVYRAEHTIWKRPVAIKFFNALAGSPVEQRAELEQAFINEGALLSELSTHTAHIVQARDVGSYTTAAGQWMPFIVLEWLEGASLDELLAQESRAGVAPWTLPQVVQLLGPIAQALEIAHQRGIAHRDIKPGNIFILGSGARTGSATVKLLDFGVAKMMTENTQMKAALAKTGSSISSFTPLYGAPEQFTRSYGATGPWTDVFALALVIVEMLLGRPALEGDDAIQLAFAAGDPRRRPTPRQLGVLVPDQVEQVFAKALAPSPADRYKTAGEFWSALESTLQLGLEQTSYAPAVAAPAYLPSPRSRANITGRPAVLSSRSPGASGAGVWLLSGGILVAGGLVTAFLLLRPSGSALPPESRALPGSVAAAPAAVPSPAASITDAAADPRCPEDMIEIAGGKFFMGSDHKDASSIEQPVHPVTLSGYCIDKTEVKTSDYLACVDRGDCRPAARDAHWPGISAREQKTYGKLCEQLGELSGNHPVACVTWHMASIYCRAQGKRLPSEAEWEYAARGPDVRIYPWGDEPPTSRHLNACGSECAAWAKREGLAVDALHRGDDGYATTAPVASFSAGNSRFGPADMTGNVSEWVNDWFNDYEKAPQSDPLGPENGQKRVIRGSAWNGGDTSALRASFRSALDPAAKSPMVGFRCAKAVDL